MFSSKVDGNYKTSAEIITYVDDTVEGAVSNIRLTADKVTIYGETTINDIFKVNNGEVKINSNVIDLDSIEGSISFALTGNSFFYLNDKTRPSLLDVRNDAGTAIRVQAYGTGSVGIDITSQSGYGTYAIKSRGSGLLLARYSGLQSTSNELITITGLAVGCKSGTTFGGASQNFSDVSNSWVDFLYATGNVTLPNASYCTGKVLFIKMGGNYSISSSSNIIKSSGSDSYTSESFNNRALFYISNGANWYEFTCYSR
jgi:hypothetical protein